MNILKTIFIIPALFFSVNNAFSHSDVTLQECDFETIRMAYCRYITTEKYCHRTASGGKKCSLFPRKINVFRSYMATGECCTQTESDKTYCKNLDVDYRDILNRQFALVSEYNFTAKEWNTSGYEKTCRGNNVIMTNSTSL